MQLLRTGNWYYCTYEIMKLQVRVRFLLHSSVIVFFYVVVTDDVTSMLHNRPWPPFSFRHRFSLLRSKNFTMRMHVVFASCNVDKIPLGNFVCFCVHSPFLLQISIFDALFWRHYAMRLPPAICWLYERKSSSSMARKSWKKNNEPSNFWRLSQTLR